MEIKLAFTESLSFYDTAKAAIRENVLSSEEFSKAYPRFPVSVRHYNPFCIQCCLLFTVQARISLLLYSAANS